VRWPRACEGVSRGTEERALLEDDTKQSSEDRNREHWSVYDLQSVATSCVELSRKPSHKSKLVCSQPLSHQAVPCGCLVCSSFPRFPVKVQLSVVHTAAYRGTRSRSG
jgi:hypothetical protein